MYKCPPEHLRMGLTKLTQDEKTEEQGKRKRGKMKGRGRGHSKKSPDGLTIARAYSPTGSLLPETMDELPNELTNTYNPSTAPWGGGF